MIKNIDVWIEELKRLREEFETACARNDGTLIERSLYYSALVVRKLSETPFVKRGFLGPCLKASRYTPSSGSKDRFDWLDTHLHFEFRKGRTSDISLAEICNLLIHSRFLDWRPASGPVKEILAGPGAQSIVEVVGFTPLQFAKVLKCVETYKFRTTALQTPKRS